MPTINIIFNSSTETVLSVEIYHILKEKKNEFLSYLYTTKCIDLKKACHFLPLQISMSQHPCLGEKREDPEDIGQNIHSK